MAKKTIIISVRNGNKKTKQVVRSLGIAALLSCIFFTADCQYLFVNPTKGNDNNSGEKDRPFATLAGAVNTANKSLAGDIHIKLFPGFYNLRNKVTIRREVTNHTPGRIIIEAVVMPDDPEWQPGKMPVIFSDGDTTRSFGFPNSVGFLIDCDHVTIQGLKFLGNPNPSVDFYYPIGRESESGDDLVVSQCIFVGEKYSTPIQAAILVNGHGAQIDHCIFYNCKCGVVYWKVKDFHRNNALVNSVFDGCYQAAVWNARADSNFHFTNNIITKSNFAWVRNFNNLADYRFLNSVISGNDHFQGEWNPPDTIKPMNPVTKVTKLIESGVIHTGEVKLIVGTADDIPNNYLSPVPGSLGYYLHAGLFKKEHSVH